MELGPRPDVAARLADLAEDFGDARPAVDARTSQARLNGLLRDARCLLILDDVWDHQHLREFRFPAARVTVLVTTRNHDSLDHAAVVCPVEVLDQKPAREMLRMSAGYATTRVLPAEADAVAAECGGLPLALAVAGGLVADGYAWADVHERLHDADLHQLQARFPDYPHPDLLCALQASVTALTDHERARYLDLAVFEGHGLIPLKVVQWWWAHAGVDELRSQRLAVRLARRSLVQLNPATQTITLHDLQFDYVRHELGLHRVQERQVRLTDTYLERWGGLEDRLPALQAIPAFDDIDQYGLLHMVDHLLAADRAYLLHRLLGTPHTGDRLARTRMEMRRRSPGVDQSPDSSGIRATLEDNLWYTVHEQTGQIASYVRDVRAAWRVAETATDQALRHNRTAPSVGLELRYAFIASSVVSVASNIPPVLLSALCQQAVWTYEHALNHAQLINGEEGRAQPLYDLAAILPRSLHKQLLTAVCRISDPRRRASILMVIAPRLSAPLLSDAVAATDGIDARYWRAKALTALAPRLPDALLIEALETARTGRPDPDYQARTLVGLIPHLPESLHNEALALALAAADNIRYPMGKASALVSLAPRIPAPMLTDALSVARSIRDPYYRTQALTALITRLGGPLRSEVVSEALADAHKLNRFRVDQKAAALTGLVPYISQPTHDEVLGNLLTTIRLIRFPDWRTRALARLVPYLPTSMIADALDVVRTIEDPDCQAQALVELGSHLPEMLMADALSIARGIETPDGRSKALIGLRSHLPSSLLPDALVIAHGISNRRAKVEALASLAQHLPEPQRTTTLADGLAVARTIISPNGRVRALVSLAPHLSEPTRTEALDDGLRAAGTIEQLDARADALTDLVPYLDRSLLRNALRVARTINDRYEYAAALTDLGPHLSKPRRRDVLADALRAARSCRSRYQLTLALASLVPHLEHPLRADVLTEALTLARTIRRRHSRTWALLQLVPCLADGLRDEVLTDALQTARRIKDSFVRLQLLKELAPRLAEPLRSEVFTEALKAIRSLNSPYGQAKELADLALYLPSSLLAEAMAMARETKSDVRAQALAGFIPRLPEPRRNKIIAEALAAAHAGSYRHVENLAALLPYLPEPLRSQVATEALSAARASSGHFYVEHLTNLVSHLPERQRRGALTEALSIVRVIDNTDVRVRETVAIAHASLTIPDSCWDPFWRAGIAAAAANSRQDLESLVAAAGKVIANTGGTEAIEQTYTALKDVGRWWP